jgi:hypothetical protein
VQSRRRRRQRGRRRRLYAHARAAAAAVSRPRGERLLVSRRGCKPVLPPPRGCECGGAAERDAPRVGERALLILLG